MCTNQSPLQAAAGKATKCKSGNIHKICSGLDLLGCDCGWKPAKEVTALLDTLDSTSTSGLAERGDIMAILDQIQWQCTMCHIILGGTYYRCTVEVVIVSMDPLYRPVWEEKENFSFPDWSGKLIILYSSQTSLGR